MAIVIREKTSWGTNWFAIIIGVFIISFVAFAVYFLFFSETPFIETIAPIQLQSVSGLTETVVDQSTILNNTLFLSLRQYIPNPDPGILGRDNPFAPF